MNSGNRFSMNFLSNFLDDMSQPHVFRTQNRTVGWLTEKKQNFKNDNNKNTST